MMIKTTIDAMSRSPKLRKKVMRSIEAISQAHEDQSALNGFSNAQLANIRVKDYNNGLNF